MSTKGEKMKSRYNIARKCLIFWTLFIGIGAVAGATGMLVDPSGKVLGMDQMLPYFEVLPFADVLFKNFVFSGIALLIVNGLTNLTAAGFLFAKKKVGIILGGTFGITLMLWICIQFYMFPFNFMSTIYFIFGLGQAITGYAAWVFSKQEVFVFNEANYPNVGTNPKQLVVYFSRMGYVKTQAYIKANTTGAEIYEIKSTEKTSGTSGFWWCGRFGIHRCGMPIHPIDIDLTKYEHVTICSPIWVLSLASPVREFCQKVKGQIREVDYILVHYNYGKYEKVVKEMDTLLGINHTGHTNIRCKIGKFKIIK